MSHHYLIRAIIERELIRKHLGTWNDFLKLNVVGPQRGGPRGKGIGMREKHAIGVRKVVYKIVQEASSSMSTPKATKKRIHLQRLQSLKEKITHIYHSERFRGSTFNAIGNHI